MPHYLFGILGLNISYYLHMLIPFKKKDWRILRDWNEQQPIEKTVIWILIVEQAQKIANRLSC